MTAKHKVFVSFHNDDQKWKDKFESICQDVIVSRSVGDGEIDENQSAQNIRRIIRDEYLRDTSVTVVLIGKLTWQRKHVDWEISASIRNTEYNPRSGLLGLFLPTRDDYGKDTYFPHTIPPRLYDNARTDDNRVPYAHLYDWTENTANISKWIHRAFLERNDINPDNHRDMFGANRSGESWKD